MSGWSLDTRSRLRWKLLCESGKESPSISSLKSGTSSGLSSSSSAVLTAKAISTSLVDEALVSLYGMWDLQSLAVKNNGGERVLPLGAYPSGNLIFSKSGLMCVQMYQEKRPLLHHREPMLADPTVVATSLQTMISYVGRLSVVALLMIKLC